MATYNVSKIATADMAELSPRQMAEAGEVRSFYKEVKSAIAQADKMMAISESPDVTYFVWMESAGRFGGIIWKRTGSQPAIHGSMPKEAVQVKEEQLNLF